jgi:hypothetical protein
MPQTVYDVGDPITSRLTLGVTPDGTTAVTVIVTRPDGSSITAPAISAWAADVKTAQWYATDDGTASGTVLHADGDWLAVWKITGTGANVAPKVYSVAPLPGTATRVTWSPFLSDAADHVPYLTVSTAVPGSQIYLGTFTGETTPTDEQAQRHIDRAVALMHPAIPLISSALYPAARAVAALRAAASLARAFPRRPEDIAAAAALDARADASWKLLLTAAETEGTGAGAIGTPHWAFPEFPTYGDVNL